VTPKERQLAAIRHELADRVSTDAISVEIDPQIAELLGIGQEEVFDALGRDGCVVAAGYAPPKAPPPAPDGRNEWGTTGWEFHDRRPYPLAGALAVADVERYPVPDPADYDYTSAARAARRANEKYAVRGPYWQPLFCRVCDLFGMEGAMLRLALDPAVFEAALERVFQHVYDYCRRLLDACGDALPIFCLGDDFATQRDLMISPADWRRFLKPRFEKLFALAKARGKVVWFHSCGNVSSVLPDLIDLGVDVWETVQLHTLPMPPRELKRQFGRHLTFFGGVCTQRLPFARPDEVRREVRRCIEALGEGGGYICGPDHQIKPDVPPENAVALFDEARSFRRPGYTL